MSRCPSCNKFCAVDENVQIEVESEEVNWDEVCIDIRMVLLSACCGDEVKEITTSLEIPIAHTCPSASEQVEYEISDSFDGDGSCETRGKGKARDTYYGATVSGKVTCAVCKATIALEGMVEESASSFEELN